jgi:hypothetical protein
MQTTQTGRGHQRMKANEVDYRRHKIKPNLLPPHLFRVFTTPDHVLVHSNIGYPISSMLSL